MAELGMVRVDLSLSLCDVIASCVVQVGRVGRVGDEGGVGRVGRLRGQGGFASFGSEE